MPPVLSPSSCVAPRWAWWVASGFGSGRLRPAPGTWGSLAALVLWGALSCSLWGPLGTACGWTLRLGSELGFLGLPIAMTALAVRASDLVTRETGEKDPGWIVADEWAGQWIALWPLRDLTRAGFGAFGQARGLLLLLVAFLAFRLFDIWKPWPARQAQALPGGQGIVADDVLAGLYALVVVQALRVWC